MGRAEAAISSRVAMKGGAERCFSPDVWEKCDCYEVYPGEAHLQWTSKSLVVEVSMG